MILIIEEEEFYSHFPHLLFRFYTNNFTINNNSINRITNKNRKLTVKMSSWILLFFNVYKKKRKRKQKTERDWKWNETKNQSIGKPNQSISISDIKTHTHNKTKHNFIIFFLLCVGCLWSFFCFLCLLWCQMQMHSSCLFVCLFVCLVDYRLVSSSIFFLLLPYTHSRIQAFDHHPHQFFWSCFCFVLFFCSVFVFLFCWLQEPLQILPFKQK